MYDDSLTLVIDHANSYAFKIDDIEERQSHINWEPLAASSAAYSLKDTFDAEVLNYIVNQVDSGNVYGSNASPINTGFGAGQTDPVNVIARMHRMLDDANVPFENRWFVARPAFYESLVQSPSKVMDMKVTGDAGVSQLRNGLWTEREVHGFKMYLSNNLPNPTGGTATRYVLAGHMSSTATASQLTKSEVFRDPDSFADVVRGLHMYGRQTLRPTALALGYLSGI